MITIRIAALPLLLALGLGSVKLIDRGAANQPTGIRLALPEYLDRWYGVDQPISERELIFLAHDTEFARKQYTNGAGDTILASIVLSGHDLDNSIHRPERCLPSQGWTILDSKTLAIDIPGLPGGVPVTRLHDVRQVKVAEGKVIPIYHLNYYWFVGYKRVTASHLQRTFLDIHDRLMHGYNQRWAYVTVASEITEGHTRFGRSEPETDKMIQGFISALFPAIVPDRIPARAANKSGICAAPTFEPADGSAESYRR